MGKGRLEPFAKESGALMERRSLFDRFQSRLVLFRLLAVFLFVVRVLVV